MSSREESIAEKRPPQEAAMFDCVHSFAHSPTLHALDWLRVARFRPVQQRTGHVLLHLRACVCLCVGLARGRPMAAEEAEKWVATPHNTATGLIDDLFQRTDMRQLADGSTQPLN